MKAKKENILNPYKFISLKTYISTEWLVDNKKKYRQVFDQSEVSFVYAELKLANKLFDQESWQASVKLRCYHTKKNKLICELNYDKPVSKSHQTIYIREGWGNKLQGSFWKRGSYYWEAWIGDDKLATRYFYIENSEGTSQDESAPISERYASIESIRLFEGPFEETPEEDRKYLKAFNALETRYIYAEMECVNHLPKKKWNFELFVKFYNEARELKGEIVKMIRVQPGDDTIFLTAGWGLHKPGSWREGQYSVEFIFMDQMIGVVQFEVGNHAILGDAQIMLPGWPNFMLAQSSDKTVDLEKWREKLDQLIGLNEIKEKVAEHSLYIQFLKLRRAKGIKDGKPINIHSVFIGNPGTGKTTVAQMMGMLYHSMGLLSKGHVHEVDRVDLVGEYIGQTAPKVKEAIDNARGGVLFIDEAYSLARKNDDSKDFGKEVIEILIKEMSNGPGDLAVIAAGYPDEMKYLLDSNPGLKSRFKHFFEFKDYLPDELFEIALFLAQREKVQFTKGAKNALKEIIIRAFRSRDRSFGNARYISDLVEKAKINLGIRIMQNENPKELSKRALQTILKQDVLQIKERFSRPKLSLPIDEAELTAAMIDLQELVGLNQVKTAITEMVQLVRYHLAQGHNVLHYFNLHTLFIGNPGTGKTTVARILARIYKALGVLERGHLVETDRQGLVAGYVGQTAIKTNTVINTAQGGVLFIDEAYALTAKGNYLSSDFGAEVIQILIKRMEDNKGSFFLFAAGYPSNMEQFLNSNPGFKSRFDQLLYFEDYSVSELVEIFKKQLSKQNIGIEKEALNYARTEIQKLYDSRDEYFGNARRIRLLSDQAIRNRNLRISTENQDENRNIIIEDIVEKQMTPSDWKVKKKSIGFRSGNRS